MTKLTLFGAGKIGEAIIHLLASTGDYKLRVVDENGADVRTGEVGELWVRGPGTARGYWGDAAATSELRTPDGWVRTGDLAVKGAFGMVRFAGRSKDVIKSGGYSVYAVEVETALAELEDIVEKLESGKVDLEASIAIYERGEALKKHCEKLLKDAETRIEKITLKADGTPSGTEPLDAG